MSNLRKIAQNRPCMIRVPGQCDGGGETTVLCHYRLTGYCGGAMKPDDLAFGAWGCAKCHAAVDGATRTEFSRDELRLMHAEACMRTTAELRKEGVVHVR